MPTRIHAYPVPHPCPCRAKTCMASTCVTCCRSVWAVAGRTRGQACSKVQASACLAAVRAARPVDARRLALPVGASVRSAQHPPAVCALQAEGVRSVEPLASDTLTPEQDQTLLCFVLVAPDGKHAFCRCVQAGWGMLVGGEGALRRQYKQAGLPHASMPGLVSSMLPASSGACVYSSVGSCPASANPHAAAGTILDRTRCCRLHARCRRA